MHYQVGAVLLMYSTRSIRHQSIYHQAVSLWDIYVSLFFMRPHGIIIFMSRCVHMLFHVLCVCMFLHVFTHICVCAVSEPTLKWKLKKLITTRPNPLQRKISAPPAVKHRTETLGRVSTFSRITHMIFCFCGFLQCSFSYFKLMLL